MGSCYSSSARRANKQSIRYRTSEPGLVHDVQSQSDPHQPSVIISWQPPSNHSSVNIIWYTIRFKPADSTEYKYVSFPPSQGRNHANLTIKDGLEPLKTFTFQIRAETQSTYGGWSAELQEHIAGIRPGLVRELTTEANPYQPSVTISWMPPDNHNAVIITLYSVRFKSDDSDYYNYLSVPPADGMITVQLTTKDGLEPFTTYSLQVQAKASSISGEWSTSVEEYIDWYCRYPPCYSSRMKLKNSSSAWQSDLPFSHWSTNRYLLPSAFDRDTRVKCTKPEIYDFCCKEHKTRFDAKYCLYPECTMLTSPSSDESSRNHFCNQDHWNAAVQKGYSFFVNVDPSSEQYTSTCKQFKRSWAKEKGVCPTVHEVLAVVNPSIEEQLRTYQETLPRWHKKTEMYFHGTRMDCSLNEFHVMCDKEKCGVCGIARNGFQQKCIGSRWQRFGRAFYLAPNSSKSHDYCVMRADDSYARRTSYNGMFLCEVAAGKKHNLRRNSTFLQGPPEGYHSVYGKSKFMFLKGDLNYDELVIFNEKAICPRFVILYKSI